MNALPADFVAPPARNTPLLGAFVVALFGAAAYFGVGLLIAPTITALYNNDPLIIYAPTHFEDARQYVLICNEGYNVPWEPLPTLHASRLNWMPGYALAQCLLHDWTGISLVFTGVVVSTGAIGLALFFGALTLYHLAIRAPTLHALVALMPLIGAVWVYLPGAEAMFLCLGMIVLWFITLPSLGNRTHFGWSQLAQILSGVPLGVTFMLTKPNALAFVAPIGFAFAYQSWESSRRAGYAAGFWSFIADMVIDQARPILVRLKRHGEPLFSLNDQPLRYEWRTLTVAVGILLGFAGWLAYTSVISGIPNYFLQQQLEYWGRAWTVGDVNAMFRFFAQAVQPSNAHTPWRYVAAWDLAVVIAALIPAVSRRVPTLIRGMLVLLVSFMLLTATASFASDRYAASTALIAIGWSCWLAPLTATRRYALLRWGFVIGMVAITWYLLLVKMIPAGEPGSWPIASDTRAPR